MPKHGVVHDYDLMANAEKSARGNKCVVCDADPVTYQWSDYSGEAMCSRCGCAYQLKWGSDEMQKEGKYPYCNMNELFITLMQEYWNHAKTFVHYGRSFSRNDGVEDMKEWLKANHPNII